MAARLVSERHGAVLLLRISDPQARNALHPDVYRAGAAALRAAGLVPHFDREGVTDRGLWFGHAPPETA